MHRAIEITVTPEQTEDLVNDLEKLDDVVGISVHKGASRKPQGDIVVVQALNKAADDVFRCADRIRREVGHVAVVTSEVASISDPDQQQRIDKDSDEAIWEEIETSLRNRGQLTLNFLLLMGLGGLIAAAGLSGDPVPQVTAFVSASIIAPAFEPIAKLPLAIAIRNRRLLLDALLSFAAGYTAFVLAAAGSVLLLQMLGITNLEKLLENPDVGRMMHPPADSYLISACAALAGILIETTYRESLLAGPVIGLIVVPTAALVGAGLGLLNFELALAGIQRFVVDFGFIVVFGTIVFLLKQRLLHRRQPLPEE
jgi:Domain of unknown function (DUF389)